MQVPFKCEIAVMILFWGVLSHPNIQKQENNLNHALSLLGERLYSVIVIFWFGIL